MTQVLENHAQALAALHGMSPYQGKLAPARARELVETLTNVGDVVADPFCGCGTVLLEAWALGRNAIGTDLNPYAVAVAKAKLDPVKTIVAADRALDRMASQVLDVLKQVDLRRVPKWVRAFYHPETLRDAIAWATVLRLRRDHFLFGCFLNLLHHQRPGFLSFPAAHVTPHLRPSLFPRDTFPDLYEYRAVLPRLRKKVHRTLRHGVPFSSDVVRVAQIGDAATSRSGSAKIDCIVTSPPYMSELDYARDNRLRLWFCGQDDWRGLDSRISPGQAAFISLMDRCLRSWESRLHPNGHIALVLGDSRRSGANRIDVPEVVRDLVSDRFKSLKLIDLSRSKIPSVSRAVRNRAGTIAEATLIYRKHPK